MIFWDSSALVRCYATAEPGHARAKSLLLGEDGHQASVLLRPEVTGAIVRKLSPDRALAASVLRVFERHLRHFHLLAIDDMQIELAVRLSRKHALRGPDAVHLAAGLTLARELRPGKIRFVTADLEQASAARAEGLKVIEPN